MVEALAVGDGKIVMLGSHGAIRRLIGPDARVIDLAGESLNGTCGETPFGTAQSDR